MSRPHEGVPAPMSDSVQMPALGESVTEGTVTRWLKQVGDRVEVDEPLLEVSTDKVDTEIPSPVAGVVEEILVGEDETVEVGAALVRIGDGSGGGDGGAGGQARGAREAAGPRAGGGPSRGPRRRRRRSRRPRRSRKRRPSSRLRPSSPRPSRPRRPR